MPLCFPPLQSGRDAEFRLDVGHHRVRQASLAELGEVVRDGTLPYRSSCSDNELALVGEVDRFGFVSVAKNMSACARFISTRGCPQ